MSATKNYSVSENTATLLAALEELVKANNKICMYLDEAHVNDEGLVDNYHDAITTARENLAKIVADAIEMSMLETREEVKEI